MTSSPQLAIPLPISTSTDQVPTDLMAAISAAEKFFVGRFPSTSARTAAIATAVRGMESWVDSDGYMSYYDGSIWRPLSGTRIGIYTATSVATSISGASAVADWASLVTIPTFAFPIDVTFEWACRVDQATPGDISQVYLVVNSVITKATSGTGVRWTSSEAVTLPYAASTSVAFKSTVYKETGTGVVVTYADTNFCQLRAIVRAQ